MTADESGLFRVGGVVVLSGPALRSALDAALVAIKTRKLTAGMPYSTAPYESLACELLAAMAADGHADVRDCVVSDPVPVDEPTVPLAEAATHMGKSHRQARRLAPQLGGRKIAGSWFVDETALRQHLEGRE